jgi:molybdenum cofactor guanylyltransferase
MSNDQLTAIILAGGKSSRMGQDKAMLLVDGIPLLLRVYQVAAACANTVYIVTPWQERYQDSIPSNCIFIREELLIDETEGELQTHGPIIGFAQGLAQVQTEWVLLLACDLPKLRVEILQTWIEKLGDVGEDAIACLVQNSKGWEPLCGFYRKSCLTSLNEFINQGGRSFQRWLQQNIVEVYPSPDPAMFFNCNTPFDLGE